MDEVQIVAGLQLDVWTHLASATVLLFDHAINFADEVEHFWSGPWTFSRGMYFCIRYLGLVQVVFLILAECTNVFVAVSVCVHKVSVPDHMPSGTQGALLFYGIEIVSMLLCQAAITIRVWYLFAHRPIIRGIAVQAYISSALASVLIAALLWPSVEAGIPEPGKVVVLKPEIVWLYVPALLIHSFLFALKVYRFVTSPNYLQRNTFLWRFLKEGMFMYACALASLLFVVIGLTMNDASHIPLYETALSGGIISVALSTVSVCRAMLRIKSLAATVHVDPGWLLNHAELSRVHWRPGATEGEIVVEMPSYELPVVSYVHNDTESALSTNTEAACGSSYARLTDI